LSEQRRTHERHADDCDRQELVHTPLELFVAV
jgi:hypothetical protein